MGGRIVHGSGEFSSLAPPLPPVSPGWSPTGIYGGAYRSVQARGMAVSALPCDNPLHQHTHTVFGDSGRWGVGCTCFAF